MLVEAAFVIDLRWPFTGGNLRDAHRIRPHSTAFNEALRPARPNVRCLCTPPSGTGSRCASRPCPRAGNWDRGCGSGSPDTTCHSRRT